MEQRIELSGFQRPKSKSLRKALGASLVSLVILASAPLAQGDQPSKESRESSRYRRNLLGQTIDAFRQDDKVKKHDELQELARQVLENRPLELLNRELFIRGVYPETSTTVPAQGPAPTEEQAAALLKDYLKKDWPLVAKLAQQWGLYIFNHPYVKERIPNPSLRAALLGLGRTIGVDAIVHLLLDQTPAGLPKYIGLDFGIPEEWANDPAIARAFTDATTQQTTIIFNPRYRAENPFLFSSVWAHEALHRNPGSSATGYYEEAVNSALETFIYLQQLSRHPELASTGTELARRLNTNAMARFNAGMGDRLGNETNGGQPLFPGSPTVTISAYLQLFDVPATKLETPGHEVLTDYLRRIQERNHPQCSAEEFNETLVACVLENQRGLTPKQLVAAANALELDTQLP